MADLRRRRARLRVRHLRAADAAAHRRGRRWRSCSASRRTASRSTSGSARCCTCPAVARRHLRPARRLPDRPVRPPPRPGLEHPALRASRRSAAGFAHVGRTGCCSGAAARSSASASSSSRPSRGCRSCSPTRSSARRVVGYTQAFGSIGGLMVTGAYYLIVTYGESLPEVHGGHEAWRYTLMSGVIPAIPLIIIRPFLPESPVWREKKRAGTLKRPSFARAVPPRVPPDDHRHDDHDGVRLRRRVRRDSADAAHRPRPRRKCRRWRAPRRSRRSAASSRSRSSAVSPDASCSPFLAAVIISRRRLLRLFQVPGLILLPLVFFLMPATGLTLRAVGHLPRRAGDDRAVQLLGKLSAARLPDPSARHRRELRGQRRRPHDRHMRRAGDDARSCRRCRAPRCRSSWPTRRRSSAPPRTSIGFIASFWLPEPKQDELPD